MLKKRFLEGECVIESEKNYILERNDTFNGKTSTPKCSKITNRFLSTITENNSLDIRDETNNPLKDASLQFNDESWMEDIIQHLDNVEEVIKWDKDDTSMDVSQESCHNKLGVINSDYPNQEEKVGLKNYKFMSDLSHMNDTELIVNQVINKSSNSLQSESKVEECLKDFNSHQISLTNDKDENITIKEEKNFNNFSYLIKEKLKQNAKNISSRTSDISLFKEAALAFALEEAEKEKKLQLNNSEEMFYGLSNHVKMLLKNHRGIEKLYDWQHECLTLSAIREEKNLIYTLPTSSGKTLVAEILIFKRLLCNKQNALFILPYISIVQEKVRSLSPFAVDLDFLIEEYAGSKGKFPPIKRRKRQTLYIATIEKAHSLINCFLESKRTEELGLVIVDEIHMIGEEGRRGAILETALTKVIYCFKQTQIIGMSATIGNINELQVFLKADNFSNNFRPVQLKEYLKVGDELWEYDQENSMTCFQYSRKLTFPYTAEMKQQDPDLLVGLVLEVIPENSCLLFCPTKKHCENVAKLLSNFLPKDIKSYKLKEKKSLFKALCNENYGSVCPILSRALLYGVAYHHSGLTMDERKLIEEAFAGGTLCCLVCTSTLATGVNLPAKRVILRAPYIGNNFLTLGKYKQIIGRAGRAGMDTLGESILIIKPEEKQKVQELLNSSMENCRSSLLYDGRKGLKILLLSLIGLEVATTCDDLKAFVKSTLLSIQTQQETLTSNSIVHDCLSSLKENGFIKYKLKQGREILETTKLGRAAFKGGIDLELVNKVYNELKTAQKCLSLHSYLHLIYLVTPMEKSQISIIPDIYFSAYMALSSDDLHTAELIGVTESCIIQVASGHSINSLKQNIVNRFYSTLILYDLWKQKTVWEVAQKYQVRCGTVQNLLANSVSFAAGILHFSQELEEFWPYQQILPNFVQQMSYCVTMELIPLMELPSVKKGRARQLYNAGYKMLSDIAKANPSELVKQIDYLPRRIASQIVSAAKMMIYEKAEALEEEAEEMRANLKTT